MFLCEARARPAAPERAPVRDPSLHRLVASPTPAAAPPVVGSWPSALLDSGRTQWRARRASPPTTGKSASALFPRDHEGDAILPGGAEALDRHGAIAKARIGDVHLAVSQPAHDDKMRIAVFVDRHDRALHGEQLLDAHAAKSRSAVTPALGKALHVEKREAAPHLDAQRIRAPQHSLRYRPF